MTKTSVHQWAWLVALLGGIGALGWFRASRRPVTAPVRDVPTPSVQSSGTMPLSTLPPPPSTAASTAPFGEFSASSAPTGARRKRTPVSRTIATTATLSEITAPTRSSSAVTTTDLTLYNVQRFKPPPRKPPQPPQSLVVVGTKQPTESALARVAEEPEEQKRQEAEQRLVAQEQSRRGAGQLDEEQKRQEAEQGLISPISGKTVMSRADTVTQSRLDLGEVAESAASPQRTERLRVGNRKEQEKADLLAMNRILSEGPPKPKGFFERWFGASEPVDTRYEDLTRKMRNKEEIDRLSEIVAGEQKTLENVRKSGQKITRFAKEMEAKDRVIVTRHVAAPSEYIVSKSASMKALQRKAVCEAFFEEVYNNGLQASDTLKHLKRKHENIHMLHPVVNKDPDVLNWLRATTIDLITPWVRQYRAFNTEFKNYGCEDPVHAMNARVEKLRKLISDLERQIQQMGVSWKDIV